MKFLPIAGILAILIMATACGRKAPEPQVPAAEGAGRTINLQVKPAVDAVSTSSADAETTH
ncbi:MAG: hypothetical protein K1X53_15650 [Candidatus Sumerlaeaceae bacterium]|nr:hypothetical protein [Candidatus Sumerlaeaceae bacterium]